MSDGLREAIASDRLREAIARLTAQLDGVSDPKDAGALLALLRLLYGVGRRDLPLGRLFEGHVDALQIVSRYGTAAQVAALAGAALGVWNADLPGDPLRRERGRLSGGKSYASGAGILSHALVTFDADGGRQLALIDLARAPPAIDRSWWHTIGMRRSETHIARWADASVADGELIGRPGDYVREPWFSGGALRFAAVQAGGVAALVDHVRDHLVATARAGDPYQAARLAELYGVAQAAAAAVRTAAESCGEPEATRLALVAAARTAVYAAGDRALTIAQEAVGLQGMFVAHPLAAAITDLAVYLRQPGPDAQRMKLGAAVAAGLLSPGL